MKAKINAANAGLSASIVKDATGSRLVIRSTTTGQEHSVRITATADAPATPGGPTLDDLVYDPPNVTPPALPPMTETAKAQNAKATLNGLAIESSNNTFSDVSDGLSITVAKVTTAPVTLTVGLDTASMKSAINDFVNAYNAINKYIADQTKYDPDKKIAATLQGDRSTLSLQSQLRAMMSASNSGASSTYAHLSDVGIELQPDGSLKVNDSKLGAAMNSNMPELAKAFTAKDTLHASNSGFAVRLQALTQTLNNSDGLVATRSQGLRASIERNGKQATALEERVAAFQERLLQAVQRAGRQDEQPERAERVHDAADHELEQEQVMPEARKGPFSTSFRGSSHRRGLPILLTSRHKDRRDVRRQSVPQLPRQLHHVPSGRRRLGGRPRDAAPPGDDAVRRPARGHRRSPQRDRAARHRGQGPRHRPRRAHRRGRPARRPDLQRGGELAQDLRRRCTGYVVVRLTKANLHSDDAALAECHRLVQPMRDAWVHIAPARSRRAA